MLREMADESYMQLAENPRGGRPPAVRFFTKSKKNEEKSAAEGRPIFDPVEYIEKHTPGDPSNIAIRPIRETDKIEFRKQYEAFRAGIEESPIGTPLHAWPGITREQIEELVYFKVRTVEDLASLSDGNLQNIGPIRALRQRAVDFLEAAKGNAHVEKMRLELSKRDAEIDALKSQMEQLLNQKKKDK